MNDTGGGVTAIHDVPGDITRIGFHWMLFFPFCHSKGGLLFCLHTECLGGHGVFLCPEFANYRIVSSHGLSRNNLFCHELSNYRISFTRNVAESTDFFVPRLVLGPTDQREVIAEFLSVTRSVADGCGACYSCEWGLFVVVYRPIWGVCV